MFAAALLLNTIATAAAEPEPLTGKVVAIADGVTLNLLVGRDQIKIRLEGIDAPESGQSFGTRARQALADLVVGKTVTVRSIGTDRYGRTLGPVYADGVDVNARLVELGYAWWYREYSDDETLAGDEKLARAARRGLWADP